MKIIILAALVAMVASPAQSKTHLKGNTECYSFGIPGERVREDITCANLNEAFLAELEGQSRMQVIALMGVTGRQDGSDELHYLSNNMSRGGYSGDVNIQFNSNGAAFIITAIVTRNKPDGDAGPLIRYIWNADTGGCSDFSDELPLRCSRHGDGDN